MDRVADRCGAPEQAQRERATLADVVISTTGKADTADLYIQLVRLDVLRQRGLLPPTEFERQKQRSLDSLDDATPPPPSVDPVSGRPIVPGQPPATN